MSGKSGAQQTVQAGPNPALPRLGYSLEEAAEILGVSLPTLFRELKEGRGPGSFVIRRRRLFSLEALREYASSRQTGFSLGAAGLTPRVQPESSDARS